MRENSPQNLEIKRLESLIEGDSVAVPFGLSDDPVAIEQQRVEVLDAHAYLRKRRCLGEPS